MSVHCCEVCGTELAPWRLGPEAVLWRCPQCGHVLRALDDCAAWARQDPWGGEGGFDRFRLWMTYRRLRRTVGPRGDVFEVGYGSGQVLDRFRADGHRVGGVDTGTNRRSVRPGLQDTPGIQVGRVEELAGSEAYDLVYAIHVVEHVEQLAEFLGACHHLLSPGGTLVLLTPTADSHGPRAFGAAWWPLEDPTHVRFLSRESARRSLEAANFIDVRVTRLAWDNLSMEFCSTVRRLVPMRRRNGVLGERWAVAGSALTAPIALLARLVDPGLRPTICVTAVKP